MNAKYHIGDIRMEIKPQYDGNGSHGYQTVVQYTRQGKVHNDMYHTLADTPESALVYVKVMWHRDNDDLFPGAKTAEFFMKVE